MFSLDDPRLLPLNLLALKPHLNQIMLKMQDLMEMVSISVVDELVRKHCDRIFEDIKKELGLVNGKVDALEEQLKVSCETGRNTSEILNAVALSFGTNAQSKKGVRAHTMAQIRSVKRLLNFEVMVRVGVHIVSKFICAHIESHRHNYELAHVIFDVLFFVLGARTRTMDRRTTAGIAFKRYEIICDQGIHHELPRPCPPNGRTRLGRE